MLRKLLLIFLLALGFGAFLFFYPWKEVPSEPPTLKNRLPVSAIIGETNLLELSDQISKLLYYYKIPFRDFVDPNIILSQGKKYGLDVQSPLYFFADDSLTTIKNWGGMIKVQDSSKIFPVIDILRKRTKIIDTLIDQQTVYFAEKFNVFLTYGSDWLLLYQGDSIHTVLHSIHNATLNRTHPRWKNLLYQSKKNAQVLNAEIQTDKLSDFGVRSALIALSNDSTGLVFNARLNHYDTLAFQIKKDGAALSSQEFTRQMAQLNFDIGRLRKNETHPYRIFMSKLGEKINFPTNELLNAWDGQLAFRRGGIEYIREQYIESVLDDDFNVTEVAKTKTVKISGFALYISSNHLMRDFLTNLQEKGILSKENRKYRLLYSPPLNLKQTDSSVLFYTNKYAPVPELNTQNEIMWTFNYTPVQFFLDSTGTKDLFGRIKIPLKKIIFDNLKD